MLTYGNKAYYDSEEIKQQIIPGYLQFDPKFPVNIVSQLIFKIDLNTLSLGFPGSSAGKESDCNAGNPVWFLGQEDLPEKG